MSASSETGFTPISPNPFIVGNPIRERAMFYGRESEFDIVRRRFKESPDEGGLLVFCGERRSGKTSILFQILNGRLGDDFIPVLVDMQSMAVDDEIGFLRRITDEIISGLGAQAEGISPPDYSGAKPAAAFHRFVGDLLKAHPSKKLILLIDEYELLETKIDGGVLSADVLLILSHLMENLAVFLIFTGSVTLEERKQEYWHRFLAKSSFRKISFLERKDALRLITDPVKDRVDWQPGVVDRIFRLTGGQPFYTQGICQGLVDQLNEHETYQATSETVDAVVRNIVENPFPQMTFRWDTLKNDEKLVLSLLAESLEKDTDHVTAARVHDLIKRRRYPLDLDSARIGAALESLFEIDMLVKDEAHPPGYAFKMDLWRRWIRRMHSVWQVLRELGMKVRHRAGRLRPALLAAGALVVVGAGAVSLSSLLRSEDNNGGPVAPELVNLDLRVFPEMATVWMDDKAQGKGSGVRPAAVGAHTLRVFAEGYRDTTFQVTLAAGRPDSHAVTLDPLRGSAWVATSPEGASISVDGEPRGKSPLVIDNLAVPETHTAEFMLAGFSPRTETFKVLPDTVITLEINLAQQTVDVLVSTKPPGAQIAMDRKAQGESPCYVRGVPLGEHAFVAELKGYLRQEEKRQITQGAPEVALTLRPEPMSRLLLEGGYAVKTKIDDQMKWSSKGYKHTYEVSSGEHTIWIQLSSEEAYSHPLSVRPGRFITFDYMERAVRDLERTAENDEAWQNIRNQSSAP